MDNIKGHGSTDWVLQYPVMSTLRPSYPRGPWHYKDMHQLIVTYERQQRPFVRSSHDRLNRPAATASPLSGAT
ncbi:acetoacetate decarboxylase [Rhizobium mesoamericanum]|nr:acetoacetate decarboxylase [Rhizobium mesoamericanum]